MAFGIIATKIIDPNGTRITYRVRGVGADYDEFYTWLRDREATLTRIWSKFPWCGWEFSNPDDDVEIRLLWADHFMEPDADERYDTLDEPYGQQPSGYSLADNISKHTKKSVIWTEDVERLYLNSLDRVKRAQTEVCETLKLSTAHDPESLT